MALPFGLKAPSRGTVIFTSIVGTISGGFFAKQHYANQSEKALCDRVAFLADRPCGVHERPRKVQVFLTAPPGDSMEKSRVWFGSYIKPVLVAAAVDYEVKEARTPGEIETMVRQRIIEKRRAAIVANDANAQAQAELVTTDANPFAEKMKPVLESQGKDEFDGVIAIGRNAWRELVTGISHGCTISLAQAAKDEAERQRQQEMAKQQEEAEKAAKEANKNDKAGDAAAITDAQAIASQEPASTDPSLLEEALALDAEQGVDLTELAADQEEPLDPADAFGIPTPLSPVIYIPQENIIGWTNIPYRIYMWCVDYKRIERFGSYAVAVALNQTQPLRLEDIDVGYQEMKYWIGDDEAKQAKENDKPIEVDRRVLEVLTTYTNDA
ncbi:hypothetical protein DM01DRAFT_1333560 [Hesseltinella vesiculosa]|uniref:Mitochondrial import inner membrane translocase subunit TIM54 n=1 Tax=Hesseltinella vesiculosa TaxID=101127 RepID=A0A1X2GQK0_9FUNG|nr:hypothetical protein DM01DRAFT_1333560 [Hesseltinella vesiculosa]